MQKQNFFASFFDGCKRGLARFTEGVFYNGDRLSDNRKRVFYNNLASNARMNLIGGSFLTGLLLLMDADDGFIGLISMITTAANVIQIVAPSIIGKFTNKRRAILAIRIILQIINVIFVGLIPLFPMENQSKLMLVAISLLIVHALSALHAPDLSSWHIKFIPGTIRVRYYSLYNRVNGIFVVVVALIASWVLDRFKEAGIEYWGLLTLRGVATIMLIIELVLLFKMDPPNDEGPRVSLKQVFVLPLKAKGYLLTAVACTFLWNIVANIPGSYYTVYLLDNVKVSYTFITAVGFVNIPILMIFTPLWTKFKQKYDSWIMLLAVTIALYGVYYAVLPFVTKNALWLYIVAAVIGNIGAAGINLAFGGIPYINIPKENQSVYIGFYSTIANLAAFLGVTIGRTLITGTADMTVNVFGLEMISKQYWLFLVAAGLIAVAGILYLISKKVPQSDG